MRRAAAPDEPADAEAHRYRSAAESHRGRHLPQRPAFLGRHLRSRQRQDAQAHRSRHEIAADHGPRNRGAGGGARPEGEGREDRRQAPRLSLDRLRQVSRLQARRGKSLHQAGLHRRVSSRRLCRSHHRAASALLARLRLAQARAGRAARLFRRHGVQRAEKIRRDAEGRADRDHRRRRRRPDGRLLFSKP